MIKILLLGATSNIGYAFLNQFGNFYKITSTHRNLLPIDFKLQSSTKLLKMENYSLEFLKQIINTYNPDVVINTIANGSIDDCEINKNSCYEINVTLVKNIVDCIKSTNIKLVHFSSSAIYSGENAPYEENDIPHPVNYYGECKKEADSYINANLKNFLILRPTAIIGIKQSFQRGNPLDFIVNFLKNSKPLKLVDTDSVNFVYINDVVNALNICLKQEIIGTYNLGGNEILNRHEFGSYVCKVLGTKNNITKCSYLDLNLLAKRGKSTAVNNSKIKQTLNIKFTSLKLVIDNFNKGKIL